MLCIKRPVFLADYYLIYYFALFALFVVSTALSLVTTRFAWRAQGLPRQGVVTGVLGQTLPTRASPGTLPPDGKPQIAEC
jgi:hypothetical protein